MLLIDDLCLQLLNNQQAADLRAGSGTAQVEGPVASIARELMARCRELTLTVNELQRQITRIG